MRKLRRNLETPPAGRPEVAVRRLTDREEILSYLEQQRDYCAVAIPYLDPRQGFGSRWFLAEKGKAFALCLLSERFSSDWVFTMGDIELLDQLLPSLHLPGRAYLTCQPDHLGVVQKYYHLEWQRLLKRLKVERESFSPAGSGEPCPLGPKDIAPANDLYRTWGQPISPGQLRKGVYFGVWQNGELISAAGTLFISKTYELGCVGNVLTRPGYRGRGLATACTSAVTSKLLETCWEVVLDVEPGNEPAMKMYGKLGYRGVCFLIEALGERRRFLPATWVSFWKKLGLSPT